MNQRHRCLKFVFILCFLLVMFNVAAAAIYNYLIVKVGITYSWFWLTKVCNNQILHNEYFYNFPTHTLQMLQLFNTGSSYIKQIWDRNTIQQSIGYIIFALFTAINSQIKKYNQCELNDTDKQLTVNKIYKHLVAVLRLYLTFLIIFA